MFRRPTSFCLAILVGFLAQPLPMGAKNKGLAGSETRQLYCAEKLGQCIGQGNADCADTYDKAQHVGLCMDRNMKRCVDRYGGDSSCLTDPKVGTGLDRPAASGGALAPEPRRPRSPRTSVPTPPTRKQAR